MRRPKYASIGCVCSTGSKRRQCQEAEQGSKGGVGARGSQDPHARAVTHTDRIHNVPQPHARLCNDQLRRNIVMQADVKEGGRDGWECTPQNKLRGPPPGAVLAHRRLAATHDVTIFSKQGLRERVGTRASQSCKAQTAAGGAFTSLTNGRRGPRGATDNVREATRMWRVRRGGGLPGASGPPDASAIGLGPKSFPTKRGKPCQAGLLGPLPSCGHGALSVRAAPCSTAHTHSQCHSHGAAAVPAAALPPPVCPCRHTVCLCVLAQRSPVASRPRTPSPRAPRNFTRRLSGAQAGVLPGAGRACAAVAFLDCSRVILARAPVPSPPAQAQQIRAVGGQHQSPRRLQGPLAGAEGKRREAAVGLRALGG